MTTDLNAQGRSTRTKLWGEENLGLADNFLNSFDAGFAKYLNEQLFGEVWNRPGIPVKTRSMITVAVLIALGKSQEMRLHMTGAHNLGITDDELKEIIVHVTHYAGVPAAIEAIRAYNDVTSVRT
jgi:4-carboxymuconolactone decarboxylase